MPLRSDFRAALQGVLDALQQGRREEALWGVQALVAELAADPAASPRQLVLASFPVGVVLLDQAGTVVSVNPVAEELLAPLGETSDLVGRRLTALAGVPPSLCDLLAAGEGVLDWPVEDGRGRRWLRTRVRRSAAGTVVVLEDQTESVLARETLAANERRFRSLVEKQGEGVGIVDASEQFVFANPAAHTIFGVEQGTLVGTSLLRFLDASSFAQVRGETRLRADGRVSSYLLTIQRPDGERRELQVTATPSFSAEGAFAGTFGTFRDVTEQVRAERALQASERRNRAILNVLPDVVIRLSRVGEVLDVQAARPEAALTPSSWEVGKVPPEPLGTALRAAVSQALAEEETHLGQLELPGPEGVRHFELRALACGHDEAMVFLRDVTERQQLEARLQAADRMASVGTLAAGVAHFINNPLASLKANIEYLTHEIDDLGAALPADRLVEMQEAASDARTCCERVRRVVADLRTFARAEAGQEERADLNRVLDVAVGMAGNEIRHRAQLVVELGELPAVRGNPAQLGQVFLALLINAIQAVPGNRSGDRVWIRARRDGAQVLVEVGDTGVGIPEAIRARIFDPFFTTKPTGQGTGLGLSISHNIVRSLGGSLEVESEPGKGTRVTVRLPVVEPLEEAHVASSPGGPRILVVDDEEMVVASLKRLLRPHEVRTSTDGREAAALFCQGGYDLMFCDVMMPGFGGMEVFEAVRSRAPGREAHIVFMSGGTFTTQAHEFLGQTPCRWIDKPFDRDLILQIVAEVRASSMAVS